MTRAAKKMPSPFTQRRKRLFLASGAGMGHGRVFWPALREKEKGMKANLGLGGASIVMRNKEVPLMGWRLGRREKLGVVSCLG